MPDQTKISGILFFKTTYYICENKSIGDYTMAMQISDSNFEEVKTSAGEKPLVIDFWATWCGPCRMIAPIVDEMAEKYADQVIIGKCNVDESSDLPMKYGIRNIPTLLFFKNGELVDKSVGALSKPELEEKIKALI
jgi:thioredoxin 1